MCLQSTRGILLLEEWMGLVFLHNPWGGGVGLLRLQQSIIFPHDSYERYTCKGACGAH